VASAEWVECRLILPDVKRISRRIIKIDADRIMRSRSAETI
jgi:hypothetical protein